MSIAEREAALLADFEMFDDWADRYRYLIELGEKLPALDDAFKTEKNKVQGCQSQVWLVSRKEGDKIVFEADSDSAITRGLIALLVHLFSGASSAEIASANLSFIEKLGFAKHLSMSRANGFASMIAMIKRLAAA
ncbi:MAG: SufE family protein [Spirochaetes bacterium]|nr:SufE family protein [Spirochaetota bacterium]MBX3720316.1 SufE family protein [Turneriella sp.]